MIAKKKWMKQLKATGTIRVTVNASGIPFRWSKAEGYYRCSNRKGQPVIYFDEPTSGLDYDSMVRVSKLIEQLSSSGVIVFVVSHDFEFIVRTCTEVVQLDDDGAIQNQSFRQKLKRLSEKYFT